MKKGALGLLGCLAILLVAGLVAGGILMSSYNRLVDLEEGVTAQWAQVENVYQRRADLIPNLVSTVQGAADFEQETLQNVIEARSRVGQVSGEATENIVDDPQAFQRFAQAQDALSSALSRLLVVVERYPQLRAVATFRDLMAQLEGAENRIAVERRRYNEAARQFNSTRRRFPTRLFVDLLGWDFEEKEYFESDPGAEEVPRVEF